MSTPPSPEPTEQNTVFTTVLYHIVRGPDARYRLVPKDPATPRPLTGYRGVQAAIDAAAQFEHDQLHHKESPP